MHTLRRYVRADGNEGFRIGYYDPDNKTQGWRVLGEVDTMEEALAWVSYLNGGSKPTGNPPH